MTATTFDRIAVQAQQIRFARVALTVIAFPFYVLGFVAAVLWLAIAWCLSAVQVGFVDVKDRKTGRADGAR